MTLEEIQNDPGAVLSWSISEADDGTPILAPKDGASGRPATSEEQDAFMIVNLQSTRIAELSKKLTEASAYFQERADYFKNLYR